MKDDMSDRFFVSLHEIVSDIWKEFWDEGPHEKKPIIELMAMYGENK